MSDHLLAVTGISGPIEIKVLRFILSKVGLGTMLITLL